MTDTLKTRLAEWTDWDGAAYSLGVCLGLWSDQLNLSAGSRAFWYDNPVGDMLFSVLGMLVTQGILEVREEPDDQYRWSPAFRGTWEPSTSASTPAA